MPKASCFFIWRAYESARNSRSNNSNQRPARRDPGSNQPAITSNHGSQSSDCTRRPGKRYFHGDRRATFSLSGAGSPADGMGQCPAALHARNTRAGQHPILYSGFIALEHRSPTKCNAACLPQRNRQAAPRPGIAGE
jgi:hypothetical protein